MPGRHRRRPGRCRTLLSDCANCRGPWGEGTTRNSDAPPVETAGLVKSTTVGSWKPLRNLHGPARHAGRDAPPRTPSSHVSGRSERFRGCLHPWLLSVEVIAQGTRSDRETSEIHFISPATAATHVRNILKATRLAACMALRLRESWASSDHGRKRFAGAPRSSLSRTRSTPPYPTR